MNWELQNKAETLIKEGASPLSDHEHQLALLVEPLLEECKKLSKELRPYRNFANAVNPDARLFDGEWHRKLTTAEGTPQWSTASPPKALVDRVKDALKHD